jgi:hypothetical protein|tara:strand:- start:87 stop:680 length:594 start_codon:yes stop_codon:yes gene_type:complete
MVDMIITQALNFWQFTVVGILIIIGFIVNAFGVDQEEPLVNLSYKEMPDMKPITIPTAGKGFWGAVWMWITGVRTWEIAKDWNFSVNGENYVIPKGFVFDGASVPKFLANWLSPVGVLLVGGLVHDYAYKYTVLLKKGKKSTSAPMTQNEADQLFRDINIEQNGFHLLNNLAYWALVLAGFMAWNKHRKANCQAIEK